MDTVSPQADGFVLDDGANAKSERVDNLHGVRYTLEQFIAAGESNFKKLPPGWKFRTKVLDEDLIEIPEGGVATIMPDEFFNVYDKTGPGMTNCQP